MLNLFVKYTCFYKKKNTKYPPGGERRNSSVSLRKLKATPTTRQPNHDPRRLLPSTSHLLPGRFSWQSGSHLLSGYKTGDSRSHSLPGTQHTTPSHTCYPALVKKSTIPKSHLLPGTSHLLPGIQPNSHSASHLLPGTQTVRILSLSFNHSNLSPFP